MQTEINKIISVLFSEGQLKKIKKTEKEITKLLGKYFLKKHIKTIYWNKNKVIIETKSIEAKTEINLIKKQFNNHQNIQIK